MNRFVVVVDDARSLPPDAMAYLDRPDLAALPFQPERHVRWADASGTVHYAGWERGAQAGADIDPTGIVAWAGMPRPHRGVWASDRRIVDILRDETERPGWAPFDTLCDAYAVVRLRPDGSGLVVSDPFGLHPLYRSRSGGLTIIGNRPDTVAELLARVTGRAPVRDLAAGAWMAFLGYHLGAVSGFEGVEVQPHDTDIGIDGGRVTSLSSPAVFDVDAEGGAADPDEVTRAISAAIADALRRAVARSDGRPQVELTGGKDSRLILAVALAAGLTDALQFVTYGAPELPTCRWRSPSPSASGSIISTRPTITSARRPPSRPRSGTDATSTAPAVHHRAAMPTSRWRGPSWSSRPISASSTARPALAW
jgi:hypothetical protein